MDTATETDAPKTASKRVVQKIVYYLDFKNK